MQRRTKIAIAASAVIAVLGVGLYSATSNARDGFRQYASYRGHGHGGPGFMGGHRGGQMASKMFEKIDANQDGAVTKAEIENFRKQNFTNHDRNGDGKLALEEFQGLWTEFTRQGMVRAFQRLDADGDGGVTNEETANPLNRMMSWADRNDDGKITKNELRGGKRGWGSRGQRWKDRFDDDDDDDDDMKK